MNLEATKTACDALLVYHQKRIQEQLEEHRKPNLLEDEEEWASEPVYVNIQFSKFLCIERPSSPILIKLPHPYNTSDTQCCLFVEDPQRVYKDALLEVSDDDPLVCPSLARIVGVSKLAGKFKPFEAKRKLRRMYDIFLADRRIIPKLPLLLGKTFYNKAFYTPVPIDLVQNNEIDREAVRDSINEILESARVVLSPATNVAIKIGTTHLHDAGQLSENLQAVMDGILEKVEQVSKRSNKIRSVFLKTNSSPSIPLWSDPDALYDEKDIVDKSCDENDSDMDDSEPELLDDKKRNEEGLSKLDQALAEVVDEEAIQVYNKNREKRRKTKKAPNLVTKNPEE